MPRGVYIRTKKLDGPNKGKGKLFQWILDNAGHTGTECLKWPGGRDTKGYGQCGYRGKIYRAHRIMCQMAWGDPPTPEHQAAHNCGNGHLGCINPMHLAWKTLSENQLDRRRHGTAKTAKFGKGGHVLTPAQRREVVNMDRYMTRTAIAEQFGVSRRTIERTIQRATR